jgi:catechol 2,3-dioxygenase-like lactoylglutathione lyase family enzyme
VTNSVQADSVAPPRILSVHHVALAVGNLQAAEAFYVALLGLPLLERKADAAGRPRSLWLRLGEIILMLERSDAPATPAGMNVLALVIAPEERAAWEDRLAGRIERRSAHTLYLRDPDGHRIGLSHYPQKDPGADPPGGGS